MSDPEPPFVPVAGQQDFTQVRWAPVVNIVPFYKNKFLLVKRSAGLRFYPGCWNGVSGFLDDQRSLTDKVVEELTEELGVGEAAVQQVELRGVFDQEAPEHEKTWIVHAVRAELTTDQVALDWEAERYEWFAAWPGEEYQLLPGFDTVLDLVLAEPNRRVVV